MAGKTNEELYEETERALIAEAIAETEQEVFDSAFDNEPDDNDADTSLEQMDGDDVPDSDLEDAEGDRDDEFLDDREEASSEDDEEPEQSTQPERKGIPSSRLREESEARRAAEAEARELRARIENLERNQRPAQPPPQQPQPPPAPDMFVDPEGWAAAERARIMQEVNTRHVNSSLADAHEQHGEKFEAAYKAVTGLNPQDPASQATVQRIWNAPNPGRELMKWHSQQSLLSEIGNDPAAYRQKLRDEMLADPEFRKEFMQGMRRDAMNGSGGQPRARVQLPPSLNSATGGTSHRGFDRGNSRDTARTSRSIEQEIFDSAWDN